MGSESSLVVMSGPADPKIPKIGFFEGKNTDYRVLEGPRGCTDRGPEGGPQDLRQYPRQDPARTPSGPFKTPIICIFIFKKHNLWDL